MADACKALLGGSNLSEISRRWTAAGLKPVQSKSGKWTRNSVRQILLNPAIGGLQTYQGEIIDLAQGKSIGWTPLVSEETWRAVRGILETRPGSPRAASGPCSAGSRAARAGTRSPRCRVTPVATYIGATR